MLGVTGWIITCLFPIYSIWASIVYFSAEQEFLPPDGDSIAIPIFGISFMALITTVVMCVINAVAFRRGRQNGSLVAWNHQTPRASALISAVFLTPALALICISVADLAYVGRVALIQFIWYPIPWALTLWLLCVRGATLTPTAAAQSNSSSL